jgi:hypothetical protein
LLALYEEDRDFAQSLIDEAKAESQLTERGFIESMRPSIGGLERFFDAPSTIQPGRLPVLAPLGGL